MEMGPGNPGTMEAVMKVGTGGTAVSGHLLCVLLTLIFTVIDSELIVTHLRLAQVRLDTNLTGGLVWGPQIH